MLRHLPNSITLVNLVSGSLAVVLLLYGRLDAALGLVLLAAVADFLDGLVARALRVSSPLGKELDSLADMVSFGLVPGIMLYGLLSAAWHDGAWPVTLDWRALPAFLIPAFAALRLAKFNLDTRQSDTFIGLATPACTLFVLGLILLYQREPDWARQWLLHPGGLYAIIVGLAALMVAEIPMFSFKFKAWRWAGNEIKIIFAALALILVAIRPLAAPSLIVLLYIGVSIGNHLLNRNRQV